MKENNVYSEIAERMGLTSSSRFVKVLEVLITPEEGRLVLELPTATTCEQLARRLNIEEKSLHTKLEDLVNKGLVRSGKEGYTAQPNITSIRHNGYRLVPEDLRPKVNDLWKDFWYTEQRQQSIDTAIHRRQTGGLPGHRIMPARKAIEASPRIRLEQILWYEDIEQILKRAKRISVNPCNCRRICRECDRPVETCLHMDIEGQEPYNRHLPQRELSLDEAIALVNDAEEAGLVHIPLNASRVPTACNCCPCCCSVLNPLIHSGKVHELLSPSRFRATVNTELCTGCQECVDRCYFDAIEMRKPASSKKLKASIVNEHCMGCGLCIFKCPENALTLELVRPPEHIPTTPFGRAMIPREA